MWPFVFGFFPLAQRFRGSSLGQHEPVLHPSCCQTVSHCVSVLLFVLHVSTGGHSGCLYFWANMNDAAMNIFV